MQTRLCKGKQISEAIKAPGHGDVQTAEVWGFRLSRIASRSSRSAHIADPFNKGQTTYPPNLTGVFSCSFFPSI